MSSQNWFNLWEAITIAANVVVIIGLFIEYGPADILSVFKWWGKRAIPTYRVKIEAPSERIGGVLVVLGIAIEIAGATGILVQSDRIETQLRNDIASLEREAGFARVRAGMRILDAKTFEHDLADKPKGTVQLWFKRNDTEAFSFAGQLFRLLGPKISGIGAEWTVSPPAPIPSVGGNPRFSPNAPDEVRYGGTGGADVVLRAPEQDILKEDPVYLALQKALLEGISEPIGTGSLLSFGDPRLASRHFVIMVGEKQ